MVAHSAMIQQTDNNPQTTVTQDKLHGIAHASQLQQAPHFNLDRFLARVLVMQGTGGGSQGRFTDRLKLRTLECGGQTESDHPRR
jgi:hypothetical protein